MDDSPTASSRRKQECISSQIEIAPCELLYSDITANRVRSFRVSAKFPDPVDLWGGNYTNSYFTTASVASSTPAKAIDYTQTNKSYTRTGAVYAHCNSAHTRTSQTTNRTRLITRFKKVSQKRIVLPQELIPVANKICDETGIGNHSQLIAILIKNYGDR